MEYGGFHRLQQGASKDPSGLHYGVAAIHIEYGSGHERAGGPASIMCAVSSKFLSVVSAGDAVRRLPKAGRPREQPSAGELPKHGLLGPDGLCAPGRVG